MQKSVLMFVIVIDTLSLKGSSCGPRKVLMAKQGGEQTDVKLQIPVSQALADEVARWAKEMEWTQSHLAAVLLELGTDDRSRVGEWLAKRAVTCLRPDSGPGWLQRGDNSAVRLQVSIKPNIAAQGGIIRQCTESDHSPHGRIVTRLCDMR